MDMVLVVFLRATQGAQGRSGGLKDDESDHKGIITTTILQDYHKTRYRIQYEFSYAPAISLRAPYLPRDCGSDRLFLPALSPYFTQFV